MLNELSGDTQVRHAITLEMFRKPREIAAAIASETPIHPSTGRPPTPPSSTKRTTQAPAAITTYTMANPTSTPLLGKGKTLPKRTPSAGVGKTRGKANSNANIMSFFKKTESPGSSEVQNKEEDDSLFVAEKSSKAHEKVAIQTPTPPRDETFSDELECIKDESPTSRYNEDSVPIKRRKIDDTIAEIPDPANGNITMAQRNGPFADDSDSDEDTGLEVKRSKSEIGEEWAHEEESVSTGNFDCDKEERPRLDTSNATSDMIGTNQPSVTTPPSDSTPGEKVLAGIRPPRLKRENTSVGGANDSDDIDDFIDDEFAEEGEEYLERRWMEEQEEIGYGMEYDDPGGLGLQESEGIAGKVNDQAAVAPVNTAPSNCPMCGGNTSGLTEEVSKQFRP